MLTLALLGAACIATAQIESAPLLLREKQFLLAHDSATGYVGNDLDRNEIKAQEKNFAGQLNCGARALDLRLGFQKSGGPLKFHHGPVYMQDQTVSNTMPSVIQWADEHPTELVLLLLSHCFTGKDSTGCDGAFSKPFTDLGIHVITNSSQLAEMTMSEAEELAMLSSGGMLLALFADSAYVDSTFGDTGKVVTYGPIGFGQPKQPHWNWDALWSYTDTVLSRNASYGKPWMTQGIWQENANVIASYLALGYSILGQTSDSGINGKLADKVDAGYFANGNFLLVNRVNDQGQRISRAFGANVTDTC
jgi:hypothetical protein